MTWTKLDDGYDEEMGHLSDRAYRLATNAIVVSRRRNLGGRFSARAMAQHLYLHHAKRCHLDELLLDPGDGGGAFFIQDGDAFRIRCYERYQPLTSAERTRRYREHRAEPRDIKDLAAAVTSLPVTENGHRDAASRARLRGGSPEPEPVESLSLATLGRERDDEPIEGNGVFHSKVSDTPVGWYVDACFDLGVSPNDRAKPRIGAEGKRLLDAGCDRDHLKTAVRELARRNVSPTLLEDILGDVHRAANGVATGRILPPPLRVDRNFDLAERTRRIRAAAGEPA